ncbi:hypothetical protein [Deinococcus alpinitundrae]|uniref:hypothetical protein n=1 Tax=Deinococcus alpinitundrae TaxID=468913 RepID=UPI001ED946F1|nr:hypothetical protein [Deinococcus alpinitundrae]
MLAGLSGVVLLSLGGLAQGLPPLPQLPIGALTQQAVQDALPTDDTVSELAVGRAAGASRTVRATAYNSEVGQTDDSPFITATGTRVRPGVIALSRDLLRIFPYGTRVTLHDSAGLLNGRVFIVEDTMNVRLANTIDIWMGSRAQALRWGVRTVRITTVR